MNSRSGFIPFAAGLVVALAIGWLGLPHLLYERREQPLRFSHKVHAETAGLACQDCHPFRADGRFAGIPATGRCAECHQQMLGTTTEERVLVEDYIGRGREVPWLGYSRQPDNVHFPHALHVKVAGIECVRCHGDHGVTDTLRPVEVDRLSGYGRDIWGRSLARIHLNAGEGKKMTDCAACHRDLGLEESCLDCHK